MKKEDFTLKRINKTEEHEDYWFAVSGETQKSLGKQYNEMCMVDVVEVVYSKDEDVVGIKRLFPFNFDVIMSKDDDLKNILRELSK